MSDAQIRQFQRDGFILIDRILAPDEVARAAHALSRIYAGKIDRVRTPVQNWPPDHVKHYVHARFLNQDFWNIATAARPAQMAAELLGTKSVSLTEDHEHRIYRG